MNTAEAHRERLAAYVEPHLARRARGEKHPVHDFLFTYYSYRPSALLTWHAPSELEESKRPLVQQLQTLLRATASRLPSLGCFGLHEWAMVYRESETRHDWPLRLGPEATDSVVESHRIGCSHFDAFRFFTPPARALNMLQPGRDDRAAFEQPGCLHAGMDLYKHAFRLAPMVGSDLIADAFELAWDIRIMDMRAAPYDFAGVRLDPTGEEWSAIKIETAQGKAEYVRQQREFAKRGAPIRQRLIAECERLLAQ